MGKPTKTINDYDPAVLDLFDAYVHGAIDRRGFIRKAGLMALGGLTAASLLDGLSPDYVQAMEIEKLDERIRGEFLNYPSPDNWQAYLAKPAGAGAPRPGVLVIHENRGRNPYIEDVTRRLAVAGFIAMSPDALTSFGGWTSDDEGRKQQRSLDRSEMMANWIAAFQYIKSHPDCSGKVGAIGFCYGGGVVNRLAVRLSNLGAGAPFYGSAPPGEEVPAIRAPLLIHYAGLDERVNAGWPDYKEALDANGKSYTMHMYEGANHGFHNDTTPRYDEEAARLAQDRTMAFFNENLRR